MCDLIATIERRARCTFGCPQGTASELLLHSLDFRRRARIARGSEDRLFFVARPSSASAPLLLGSSALLLLPRGHYIYSLFVSAPSETVGQALLRKRKEITGGERKTRSLNAGSFGGSAQKRCEKFGLGAQRSIFGVPSSRVIAIFGR